jgi:hypothetical protein
LRDFASHSSNEHTEAALKHGHSRLGSHSSQRLTLTTICTAVLSVTQLLIGSKTIQTANDCDITGISQHGFKQGNSTSTLGIKLQSMIARVIDEDSYILVSSLDFSATFDIINVPLLLKRLRIGGLPSDVVGFIAKWLTHRSYFVSINGSSSELLYLLFGTVQGSILGPILYAIFVSHMFDTV